MEISLNTISGLKGDLDRGAITLEEVMGMKLLTARLVFSVLIVMEQILSIIL